MDKIQDEKSERERRLGFGLDGGLWRMCVESKRLTHFFFWYISIYYRTQNQADRMIPHIKLFQIILMKKT